MKKKVTIERKDGIVFTREIETQDLTININMRYNAGKLAKLKEIAAKKEIGYQELIRRTLDNLLEECE